LYLVGPSSAVTGLFKPCGLAVCQYLVERGADLEIANRHGHTCLMIACYKAHLAIVRYLLDRGADVRRKSLKGKLDFFFIMFFCCSSICLYMVLGWKHY